MEIRMEACGKRIGFDGRVLRFFRTRCYRPGSHATKSHATMCYSMVGKKPGIVERGIRCAVSQLIVAYLFLGGAGAGAFAVLACIDFRYCRSSAFSFRARRGSACSAGLYSQPVEKRYFATLTKRGYAASFVVLALGAICLLADLGRPEIAYMLFTQPTLSYISVGTYSLTALLLCVAFVAAAGCFSLPGSLDRIKPMALVIGFAAALLVMTYTGVFLQSMKSIALWNSPWLIALFFLSALSTGIALVMLCSISLNLDRTKTGILQRLAKTDLVVIVLEFAACAVYLITVSGTSLGAQSVKRLIAGDNALVFMAGFVVCGLAVPGIMNAVSARKQHDERIDLAIACLVLLGGFCLRLSLFDARIHSSM